MKDRKKRLLWTLLSCAAAALLAAAVWLVIRYYPADQRPDAARNMERFRALLDSFGIAGALVFDRYPDRAGAVGVIGAAHPAAAGLTHTDRSAAWRSA